MGQLITVEQSGVPGYPATFKIVFNGQAGKSPDTICYSTHLADKVTPQRWLQTALRVAAALGIHDVPYIRQADDKGSLTYTLCFNDEARMRVIRLIVMGIQNQRTAIIMALPPTWPTEKLKDYIAATLENCDRNDIPCYYEILDPCTAKFVFESEIDMMAVSNAVRFTGEIKMMASNFSGSGIPDPDFSSYSQDFSPALHLRYDKRG